MNSKNRYQSNTTFTKRPGLPQIASYIVFALETVLFYAVVMPNFDSRHSKIAFTICYSASLVALIATTIVSSLTDPSDPIMIKYRNGSNEEFEQYRKNNKQKLLYCDYCRSFVREKSRHCKTCDRCVENFDHHCMWINNCVGDQNYKAFMLMILSAFCNLTVYVLSVIVLTLEKRFDLFLGGFVTAWISGVVNSIFAILIINLIFLHIYLICNDLSTYEFIMAQREQEKKRKEQELEAKNSAATSAINKREVIGDQQSKNEQITNEQIKFNDNSKGSENVIYVQSSKGSHRQEQPIPHKIFNNGRDVQSIIFGEKDMTEKSEGFNQNELEEEKNENSNENSDEDESSSVQISQLFTRNKSLKLIIGKSDYYKPHKAKKKEQEMVRELKTKSMFANIKNKK